MRIKNYFPLSKFSEKMLYNGSKKKDKLMNNSRVKTKLSMKLPKKYKIIKVNCTLFARS